MTREKKKQIDLMWIESDYGEWCVAVSKNQIEEAKKIQERLFNSGYLMMSMLEDELASRLSTMFESEDEVDVYLEQLDKEKPQLVETIIRQELFWKVREYLIF